jgi:APA family basic amino acid/polyamine antiporter
MKPGSAAIIAAGLLRFVGFLLPSVARPIFSWNLRLPFQPQPYQFAFTYAQPLAALSIVLVAAMNYLGVRTVGRFQIFLTALKLAAVALILGLGFAAKNAIAVDRSAFTLSHGALVAFVTALVPVMAAYNGFQGLGPLGGEVLNPGRNLPRAAILGTSLVIFVYLLINWMYFHLLSFSEVAHSQHIASDVVALLIGQAGAKWFTIAMIVSAFGALHANFLIGPRVPYAMSRDGNFFAFASHVQPTFHSPSGALIFQGCVAVLLVLTGTHQELYSYTMFATWMFLGLTAGALIRQRSTQPDMPRPFHVWGYPWAPLVFGISAFVISVNLWLVRPVRSSVGLMTVLVGIPFFYYWRGRRVPSSHLVEATPSGS